MRYLIWSFFLLFSGCSVKNFSSKESKIVIIKSPKLRFSDIGYIKHDGEAIELEFYSAGVAVETISVDNLVCVHDGCMSKGAFNAEYLNASYPSDTLENILMRRPIYGGKNLVKNDAGFEQHIRNEDVDIIYRVKDDAVFFKDRKNRIIFKLKNIGQ